jgi:hypothetical protein
MPLFTFYPARPDGASAMFEAHELPHEAAAARMAQLVLDRHPSGDHVVVWCEDRLVLKHGRTPRQALRPAHTPAEAHR